MSDCPGISCVDPATGAIGTHGHCSGCAENAQLRELLGHYKEALTRSVSRELSEHDALVAQMIELRDLFSQCVVDGANVTAERDQLRAHLAQLAQRTAALTALLDWVSDEEPCTRLTMLMEQADRALADLPEATEKNHAPK